MNQPSRFSADGIEALQVAWEDGGRIFCRGHRVSSEGNRGAVLVVFPAEPATPATGDRFAHEYGLREGLDGSWAVQPLELVRQPHRSLLMLDHPGGEPLERLLGAPIDVGRSCASLSASRALCVSFISAALSTRTSSRQISW